MFIPAKPNEALWSCFSPKLLIPDDVRSRSDGDIAMVPEVTVVSHWSYNALRMVATYNVNRCKERELCSSLRYLTIYTYTLGYSTVSVNFRESLLQIFFVRLHVQVLYRTAWLIRKPKWLCARVSSLLTHVAGHASTKALRNLAHHIDSKDFANHSNHFQSTEATKSHRHQHRLK